MANHKTLVIHGMGLTVTIPGEQVERVGERTFHDLTTYGEQFSALLFHAERQYRTSETLHLHLSPELFEAVYEAVGATAKEFLNGTLPADNRVTP